MGMLCNLKSVWLPKLIVIPVYLVCTVSSSFCQISGIDIFTGLYAGTYSGKVKDVNNYAVSIVTPSAEPLTIITPPLSQTDCHDRTVKFSVAVSGSVGTVSYKWQKKPPGGEFTDIPDSDNSILTIPHIGVNGLNIDGTEYRVVISDNNSTITSSSAVLHINSISPVLPKIVNSAICYGDVIYYTAPVTGTVVSYQWECKKTSVWQDIYDGTNYAGTKTSKLLIKDATASQNGNYRISVVFKTVNQTEGNPTCTLTSNEIRNLIVRSELKAPIIKSGQKICYNEIPDQLTSDSPTGGSGPYTYQWQSSLDNMNWTNIPDATLSTYSPEKLSSSTYYRLIISDNGIPSCGEVVSDAILISVYPKPDPNPIVSY